jgi:hypothetical protein
MTFYSHYCGSVFKSVTINTEPVSCCGDDCNCCHNETVSVKINDDYSTTSFSFDFHSFEMTRTLVQQQLVLEPFLQPLLFALANNLPPPPIQTILSSLQTYRL